MQDIEVPAQADGGASRGADSPADPLRLAEERLEAARAKRDAYSGASDHVRRKLDAALRSAEYDVAILRYANAEA